ncbi:MAG: aggregation factor core [Pseudomonadota bacterium]
MTFRLSLAALVAMTSPALADITVRFTESAPKDRFTITNTAECALPAGEIAIDLSTAPAGLIFDVSASGAGVEVFQPLEIVEGAETLRSVTAVTDGDERVVLDHAGLPAGGKLSFTIDVDDTRGVELGQIRVSGGEILGATAELPGTTDRSATFDRDGLATIETDGCLS